MIPKKWLFFHDSSLCIPYIVLWFNVCNKELLTLRNNFRVTKKFLIAKFDCTPLSKNECLWQRITCGSSGWNVRYSWYISSMSLIGLSNLFYHFEIAAFLKNYVTAWMVWMHQDFIFGFNFSVWDFSFQSTQKVLEWILIENSGSKPMTTYHNMKETPF